MREFKIGEHSSWDPDEVIQTWDKKASILAGGEVSKDEKEEVSTPAIGSPMEKGPQVETESAEPDAGAKDAAVEPREKAASHEDITID